MLTFIVPLKSRAVSSNWQKVQQLFERTLGSICNQTHADFQVIVVGHEKPDCARLQQPQVRWLAATFPPPTSTDTTQTMSDKWRKVGLGLIAANAGQDSFYMIVDADDLISCRLAATTATDPDAPGWIIRTGYRYRENSRIVIYDENFNCGTNAIINGNRVTLPRSEAEFDQCIMLTCGHTGIAAAMAAQGCPLLPLPFPGAVYVFDHGDNDSVSLDSYRTPRSVRFLLGKLRRSRYLGKQLRREFGF